MIHCHCLNEYRMDIRLFNFATLRNRLVMRCDCATNYYKTNRKPAKYAGWLANSIVGAVLRRSQSNLQVYLRSNVAPLATAIAFGHDPQTSMIDVRHGKCSPECSTLCRIRWIFIEINTFPIAQLLNEVINLGLVYPVVLLPSFPRVMRMLG